MRPTEDLKALRESLGDREYVAVDHPMAKTAFAASLLTRLEQVEAERLSFRDAQLLTDKALKDAASLLQASEANERRLREALEMVEPVIARQADNERYCLQQAAWKGETTKDPHGPLESAAEEALAAIRAASVFTTLEKAETNK